MKIDRKFHSLKSDYNSEKRCDDVMLSENGHMHIDISINYCFFYHIGSCYIMRLCGMFKLQENETQNKNSINGKRALKFVKIERMKERLERIRAVVRINKLKIHRNIRTHTASIFIILCLCVCVCVRNQQHLNHVIEFFCCVCVDQLLRSKKSFNYLLHGWCRCCLIFSLDTHCQSPIP